MAVAHTVCPSCGAAVDEGDTFCSHCGTSLQQAAAPPPPPPAGPPYPPSGTAAYPPPMMQSTKTNGMAIASLVLGILWISGVGSLLALIFGIIGKNQIDASRGRESGRGMAIAGIVLGIVGIAGAILLVILIIAAADSTTTNSTY